MACSTESLDDGGVRVVLKRPEITATLRFNVDGELIESDVEIHDVQAQQRVTIFEGMKRAGFALAKMTLTRMDIGTATAELAEQRMKICRTKCKMCVPCIQGKRSCCGKLLVGDPNTKACGCVLEEKVWRANESCPLDDPLW